MAFFRSLGATPGVSFSPRHLQTELVVPSKHTNVREASTNELKDGADPADWLD